MIISAKLNYFRMSPRKVRVVAKIIKNLKAENAEKILSVLPKKSAQPLLKLLRSAISNAKNKNYDPKNLYVKNVIINDGPKNLKRYYPKARGRVGQVIKRQSHIEIVLDKK